MAKPVANLITKTLPLSSIGELNGPVALQTGLINLSKISLWSKENPFKFHPFEGSSSTMQSAIKFRVIRQIGNGERITIVRAMQ